MFFSASRSTKAASSLVNEHEADALGAVSRTGFSIATTSRRPATHSFGTRRAERTVVVVIAVCLLSGERLLCPLNRKLGREYRRAVVPKVPREAADGPHARAALAARGVSYFDLQKSVRGGPCSFGLPPVTGRSWIVERRQVVKRLRAL